MTPDDLAAIRERDELVERNQKHRRDSGLAYVRIDQGDLDRRALLAHLDAITAAVEALPWFEPDPDFRIHAMNGEVRKPMTSADHVEAYRAAVLAILTAARPQPQTSPQREERP